MLTITHALRVAPLAALGLATVSSAAMASSIECGTNYTVVSGDSLSVISQRAYGSLLYQPIYNANIDVIGTNPDRIFIDQVFVIPCLSDDGSVVAAASGSQVDGATETVLVFTFSRPSAPPFVLNSGIIDLYLAEITEVTEGRVTFVDPENMLRDHSGQFDLVTSGEVDGAYVLNSQIAASHPLLQLPMLPMFGGSAEQTAVSLWRLHETYLAQTDYFSDAQLLGFVSAPAAHIWREDSAPVTTGENIVDSNIYHEPYFHGLDTRGPAAMREELAAMQADIDAEDPPAYFMAHGAALATGLWTAGSSVTVTEVDNGLYTPTFSVVLSNEAWAQISEEDRNAITEISGEKLAHRSASWDEFDNGFRSRMLSEGLNFVKADRELLDDLWVSSFDALLEWSAAAESHGIEANEAIVFYLESLRSLEETLLFRGDETFVDQHPFVSSGS